MCKVGLGGMKREGASSGKERAEGGIPVVVGWVEDGGKEQRREGSEMVWVELVGSQGSAERTIQQWWDAIHSGTFQFLTQWRTRLPTAPISPAI